MGLSNTLVHTATGYTYHPIGSVDGVDRWVELRMVVADDAREDDLGFQVLGWEVAWIEADAEGRPRDACTQRWDGEAAKQEAVKLYMLLAHHTLKRFERVHSDEWAEFRPGGPHG